MCSEKLSGFAMHMYFILQTELK